MTIDTITYVTLDEIRAAAGRVRGTAVRTPVLSLPWPGSGPSHPFWIKCENLQPMGAFKVRGAFNMLAQLPADARARGVITYSSGNHGQGVAMAAQAMGVPAVIVMPTTAPAVKVDGVRRLGAEVIFEGTTSLDRQRRAEAEAAARGLSMIPPFDHPMIIAGQGTVGLEVLEQVPDVGTVFVPMGGGGLVSGVSAALKQARPGVRVVGVEPENAAKMRAALDAGRPVTLERSSSIADGLMNLRAGALNFAHVQRYVDDVVAVPDDAIAAAVKWLYLQRQARRGAERCGDHRRGHAGPRCAGGPGGGHRQRRQRAAGAVCFLHHGSRVSGPGSRGGLAGSGVAGCPAVPTLAVRVPSPESRVPSPEPRAPTPARRAP